MDGNEVKNSAHLSAVSLDIPKRMSVIVPTVYRYLPSKYVNSFFSTGEFRLSSFAQFSKHEDIDQGDKEEGVKFLLLSDHERSRSAWAQTTVGHKAYVSSFTTRLNSMSPVFGDAVIEIFEPIGFCVEIANEIPGSISMVMGHCIYEENTIIESFGRVPYADEMMDEGGNISFNKMQDIVSSISGPKQYFLKSNRYESQAEFRMIWETNREVSEPLIVSIQDSHRFCRRRDAV